MCDCSRCIHSTVNHYSLLAGRIWYCDKLERRFEAWQLGSNFTCEFYREVDDTKEEP